MITGYLPVAHGIISAYLIRSLILSGLWLLAWFPVLLFMKRFTAESRFTVVLFLFLAIPVLPLIKGDYFIKNRSDIYSAVRMHNPLNIEKLITDGAAYRKDNAGSPVYQSSLQGEVLQQTESRVKHFHDISYTAPVFIIWLAGSLLFFAGISAGLFKLKKIVRESSVTSDEKFVSIIRTVAEKLEIRRYPELRISETVSTPLSFGILKPVIIIPSCVIRDMDKTDIEQVLVHESSHIERHDYIAVILQRVMEALFFFNPAVWYLSGKLSGLQEECCDDIVIDLTGDRFRYAENILAILRFGINGKSRMANGISGRGGIFRRVMNIMENDKTVKIKSLKKTIVLIICGTAAGLLLVMCANISAKPAAGPVNTSKLPENVEAIIEQMHDYEKKNLTEPYMENQRQRLGYIERAIAEASAIRDNTLKRKTVMQMNIMKAGIVEDPGKSADIYREELKNAKELGEREIEGECLLRLGEYNLNFSKGKKPDNEKMIADAVNILKETGRMDILTEAYFFRMAKYLEEKKYSDAVSVSAELAGAVRSGNIGGEDSVASAVAAFAESIKSFSPADKVLMYSTTAEIFSIGSDGRVLYTGQPGFGGNIGMSDREMDLFDFPVYWSLGNNGGIAFEWIKEGESETVKSFSFGKEYLQSVIRCEPGSGQVKVPAGIFSGCRHISITVTDTPLSAGEGKNEKRAEEMNGILKGRFDIWYSRGTGIVKINRSRRGVNSSLVLTEYKINDEGGSSLFPLAEGNYWKYRVSAGKINRYRSEYVSRVERVDDGKYYMSHYGYAVRKR